MVVKSTFPARQWATMGVIMMGEGLVARAIGYLHKALELDPGSANLHNCLGVALDQLGRTGEAARTLR